MSEYGTENDYTKVLPESELSESSTYDFRQIMADVKPIIQGDIPAKSTRQEPTSLEIPCPWPTQRPDESHNIPERRENATPTTVLPPTGSECPPSQSQGKIQERSENADICYSTRNVAPAEEPGDPSAGLESGPNPGADGKHIPHSPSPGAENHQNPGGGRQHQPSPTPGPENHQNSDGDKQRPRSSPPGPENRPPMPDLIYQAVVGELPEHLVDREVAANVVTVKRDDHGRVVEWSTGDQESYKFQYDGTTDQINKIVAPKTSATPKIEFINIGGGRWCANGGPIYDFGKVTVDKDGMHGTGRMAKPYYSVLPFTD